MARLYTTCTEVAWRTSPIGLPKNPGLAAQPQALSVAAHLAYARYLRSAWKSGERQPQGLATRVPLAESPQGEERPMAGSGWTCCICCAS